MVPDTFSLLGKLILNRRLAIRVIVFSLILFIIGMFPLVSFYATNQASRSYTHTALRECRNIECIKWGEWLDNTNNVKGLGSKKKYAYVRKGAIDNFHVFEQYQQVTDNPNSKTNKDFKPGVPLCIMYHDKYSNAFIISFFLIMIAIIMYIIVLQNRGQGTIK